MTTLSDTIPDALLGGADGFSHRLKNVFINKICCTQSPCKALSTPNMADDYRGGEVAPYVRQLQIPGIRQKFGR